MQYFVVFGNADVWPSGGEVKRDSHSTHTRRERQSYQYEMPQQRIPNKKEKQRQRRQKETVVLLRAKGKDALVANTFTS